MTDADKPIPVWQKVVGVAAGVALASFVVFDWARFKADFIPVDHSNVGPNLVASVVTWALVLIVAALVWPPTRRRIHRFVDRKTDGIHAKLDGFAATHKAAAAETAEVKRRLDHIIKHHPDIPDLDPPDEG